MARITPIDVIQGISGKYGGGSSDYFATNTSSNRIHIAKYKNKPTGPLTQSQKDQMEKFATQARQASAWLRANHPSAENGNKGTEAYQRAQAIKRQLRMSNVRQVVIKYMDEQGNVSLPMGDGTTTGGTTPLARHTLTLSASPAGGGTLTGAGEYDNGTTATIEAIPAEGYTFDQWTDGDTNARRTVVMQADLTLTAIFKSTTAGGGSGGEEGGGSPDFS